MKGGVMLSIKESPSASRPADEAIYVMDQATFCRLRVWTEQEWADLPPESRPPIYVHAPGLGWVGAEPIAILN
jgi:hypothetical protein